LSSSLEEYRFEENKENSNQKNPQTETMKMCAEKPNPFKTPIHSIKAITFKFRWKMFLNTLKEKS